MARLVITWAELHRVRLNIMRGRGGFVHFPMPPRDGAKWMLWSPLSHQQLMRLRVAMRLHSDGCIIAGNNRFGNRFVVRLAKLGSKPYNEFFSRYLWSQSETPRQIESVANAIDHMLIMVPPPWRYRLRTAHA